MLHAGFPMNSRTWKRFRICLTEISSRSRCCCKMLLPSSSSLSIPFHSRFFNKYLQTAQQLHHNNSSHSSLPVLDRYWLQQRRTRRKNNTIKEDKCAWDTLLKNWCEEISFILRSLYLGLLVTCNCPTLQKACWTLSINNTCIGWIIIFMTINGCSWKTESSLSSAPLHVMFNFITFLNLGEFSPTSSSSHLCSSFSLEKLKSHKFSPTDTLFFFPCFLLWISLQCLALVRFKLLKMCLAHEYMKLYEYSCDLIPILHIIICENFELVSLVFISHAQPTISTES